MRRLLPTPPRARSLALTSSALIVCATAAACGGTPPACSESAQCGQGLVCQPSGSCAPVADEASVGSIEIAARDWAMTTADAPSRPAPDTDVLLLGGPREAEIHLAFDRHAMPGMRVRRAILRLAPAPDWPGADRSSRIVVHRTEPFDGETLTRRNAPDASGAVVTERFVGPTARAMTLDVTNAFLDAERLEVPVVYLVIRQVGQGVRAWRLASPRAGDRERRPALSLFLR